MPAKLKNFQFSANNANKVTKRVVTPRHSLKRNTRNFERKSEALVKKRNTEIKEDNKENMTASQSNISEKLLLEDYDKDESIKSDNQYLLNEEEPESSSYNGNEISINLRTIEKIEAYKRFHAARVIQKFVKGFIYRQRFVRLKIATIQIQTEWRRFSCERKYFYMVQELLQKTMNKHYHAAAIKIQSVWRGWWVRTYIHDHMALLRHQRAAGEELLKCIAFKLHHLLRTHQIPGVYSMQNSSALSHVEKLLSSLTFRKYNYRTKLAHNYRDEQIQTAKKVFKKSAYGTHVPFCGPNHSNDCETKCLDMNYKEKDIDRKMMKILKIYEQAQTKAVQEKQKAAKSKEMQTKQFQGFGATFCDDIVRIMKKWKILRPAGRLQINPKIFETPDNIESFLRDVMSEKILGQCSCHSGFRRMLRNKEKQAENRNNS